MTGTSNASRIALAVVSGLALLIPSAGVAGDRSADDVTPPRVIPKYQIEPVFPPAAKAARLQGEVTVRVTVLPTGLPDGILVLQSTHTRLGFEEAAVAAVEKWRFIPAMHQGHPVEYETQYRLTFGRRGVGVAGSNAVRGPDSRVPGIGEVASAPISRPTNTGGSRGARTSPSRR